MIRTSRITAFAALCLVAGVFVGGYLYMARLRSGPIREVSAIPTITARNPTATASVRRSAHVAFRNTVPGPDYGTLSFVPLDDLAGARYSTTLVCNRVYLGGGRGFCLATEATERLPVRTHIFDDSLVVQQSRSTFGVPSRVRVSRDGRLAGYTVFVGADSYATTGFSTRTRLLSLESGQTLADLEMFETTRDGQVVTAVDVNYWGVTFAPDGRRFYATLATRGRLHLVEGDIAGRRMTVIHDGVECPSLSPDGTKIAFKTRRRQGAAPIEWQPAVLDLATLAERALPEARNVDDQIEWLDDGHIVYAVREGTGMPRRSNLWRLSIDGATPPEPFLTDAESPVVIRP